MSYLDRARQAVGEAVDKHGDKIADGIDRAARLADDKTGGQHTDKIAAGAEKARSLLDRLGGTSDDPR